MNNRLERFRLLIGSSKLEMLAKSNVLVAGLGAVGSYAVEALARSGVGTIQVVDFDIIRESNINRQLYALTSTIGSSKVDIAQKRINDINPSCKVIKHETFIDSKTIIELIANKPDAVIDAIDSVSCKTALLKHLFERGIFTVSSMGAASRLDPSRIRISDISETNCCPLARQIRKRLSTHGIKKGIRCVYSDEPVIPSSVQEPAIEKDFFERGRKRRSLGSSPYVTGIFGLFAAGEVIRKITDC